MNQIKFVLKKFSLNAFFAAATTMYQLYAEAEVFLRKGVMKICSKHTGEHPCRSAISINLQSNFIEIIWVFGMGVLL